MLKALYEHLYSLMTFKHNGQGLKTEKSFTFVLLTICFIISLISESEIRTGIIILKLLAFVFIYFITNKDLINGFLLGLLFFLAISFILPALGLIVLIWVLLATTRMQKLYLTNKH